MSFLNYIYQYPPRQALPQQEQPADEVDGEQEVLQGEGGEGGGGGGGGDGGRGEERGGEGGAVKFEEQEIN